MNARDDAISHLREALDLLNATADGSGASTLFAESILPGCSLRVSGPAARDGSYSYYLSLPQGLPRPKSGWWMINPKQGGHYWTSASFGTKEEAARRGLIRLLEATQAIADGEVKVRA